MAVTTADELARCKINGNLLGSEYAFFGVVFEKEF